jgi:ATP-dependent RNA helicase DeaD
VTDFADLGLSGTTLEALSNVGYSEPSPIQEQTIPPLLEGRDIIGQAQTGSGKTAAFGLPIIEYIDPDGPTAQALVLTPTRELCIQVTQALRAYGEPKGVDVVAVFGGAPIKTQQAQLRGGGQIVVGTVGRVSDLIQRVSLVLHDCRFVVLDEADEMLDLGFLEDVEKILMQTPNGRQTALFSATMPPPIRKLADRFLYEPEVIRVEAPTLTVDTVEQFQVGVDQKGKPDMLVEVLAQEKPTQAIVFVRTKVRCDQLFKRLRDRGMNAKALHGDMSQGSRDGVMLSFKGGRVPILVATDVAARGLDISTVTHVVNYDVPTSPDVYVHRIGRTGRIGRSGRAITFVEPRQTGELEAIEKHIGASISPWSPGATTEPAAVTEGPKRHDKPEVGRRRRRRGRRSRDEDGARAEGGSETAGAEKPDEPSGSEGETAWAKLVVGAGSADGLEPADLVRVVTSEAGIGGEEVRDVKVLERFAFLSVPEDRAQGVVEAVSGSECNGTKLELEPAGS